MNNGNLGHDCRNNANNSTFQPIIDEVNKITYIKNNYSLIDSKASNFVNSDLLEKEMEQNFQQKVKNTKNVALFKNAKVPTLNHQRSDDKDVLERRKKIKKRKRRSDISFKIDGTIKNKKIMIDFDSNECNRIKFTSIKRDTTDGVKVKY